MEAGGVLVPPRKSVLVSGRDRALNARNLTGALRIAHRIRRNLFGVIKALEADAKLKDTKWEPPGAIVDKARKLTQSVVELSEEIRASDLAAMGELGKAEADELERVLLARLVASTSASRLRELAAEKEQAERDGDRRLS
jgi:hypothetical protein